MYVWMYVCMYWTYALVYGCMYVWMCVYACMHVCMCICMYVCMHLCMYACMFVCMYVMYVCMYERVYVYKPNFYATRIIVRLSRLDKSISLCTYIHKCIHIYIHAYIHTIVLYNKLHYICEVGKFLGCSLLLRNAFPPTEWIVSLFLCEPIHTYIHTTYLLTYITYIHTYIHKLKVLSNIHTCTYIHSCIKCIDLETVHEYY